MHYYHKGINIPITKWLKCKIIKFSKTCLIAFGTARSGFSDSPAVIPINSVPWNEKPAIKNTPRIDNKLPPKLPPKMGPSPLLNISNHNMTTMIPTIVNKPIAMKTITVTTFINASQYSLSP